MAFFANQDIEFKQVSAEKKTRNMISYFGTVP